MLQSHLHTPRDRLTDIMNSYLLLICISFVPASVSICATLPLWFSKHMQNRIIRLSGLALLSLIMAGGLLLAFACQNPWFGLSCIAVSSINIPLFRHYELLLSTLRCAPNAITFHCTYSPSTRIPTNWHAATAGFTKDVRNKNSGFVPPRRVSDRFSEADSKITSTKKRSDLSIWPWRGGYLLSHGKTAVPSA